ncbi:hypothetical protein BGX28_003549 [Mortierella sp. GBA30]|nr:hypothetical protein BGX28_003549 [Mortierella sp. GBA30]
MSNHPDNLDIYDSAGPPAGILTDQKDEAASMISVMQDISTFGIAGRIWDSSYVLDIFLRRPVSQYTFTPPCPIPSEYFLPSKASALISTTTSSQKPSETESSSASESSELPEPTAKTMTTTTTPTTFRPIRILEIGAGTGYVGIALAKRLKPSCTLILTDLEEVVPLMEKNVQENLSSQSTDPPYSGQCATVKVEPLAWGNSEHAQRILGDGGVDFVVASDLVYFPELYPPLLQTLREITKAGETKVVFGYKERALWKESPFWEEFGRYFEVEVVRIERHAGKKAKNEEDRENNQGQGDEEEEEDLVEVFGCEERMYVFVATKRKDNDILEGVDDTLTTLMMMQISI